ncbi:cyclin-like protein [Wolfiporia cocos MD-104 SS10]|uniref:Cyclin-like protein n=1 Tax=Wolfiporia cocos (strain MD-104) TaxID=742152 RepID=A0A2H3IVT9_WOLCO|nr:cyclin-like protein [Wolfiporia cocos MD-104 SS10]
MTTGSTTTDASSSKLSLYEGSTQYRHWRFSAEQLAQARASLNATAVSAIGEKFEAGSSSGVSFLSADEEVLLVKFYLAKCSQLCIHLGFPEEVEATAMTYLKRFYLKNTVMDFHPKDIMLTAVFLATKTTNHPVSLESYAQRIPKTQPSDILGHEFLVAQSLGFDFAVWHAHRALWGLWLDVQNLPDVNMDELRNVYESAVQHVRAARLTDVELIYTPSQISLTSFALASPALAAAWARSKIPTEPEPRVLAVIEPIKQMIASQGAPPEVEAVRAVDRRLRLCKNPEKVVGSNAYMKKQEETERKAEEKRKRKAAEVQKAMEDADPFGSPLARDTNLDDDDDDDD